MAEKKTRKQVGFDEIEKKVRKLYVAANAFGNKQLIELGKQAMELTHAQQRINLCKDCDSEGELERECDQCYGTGLANYQCEHNGEYYN